MTTFRDRPGIRLVRPLDRDAHTEALLVRLGDDDPRPAVLLRALDEVGARMRRRELAALDRAGGAGVLAVLDVVDDDVSASALVERVAGPRLSSLVAERTTWRAGEVVTALGTLTATLARLHDAGVAHGALAAAHVVVAETGVVLDGFLQAELFAPASPEVVRERVAGVSADRAAVRELAGTLLSRVEGARAGAARELAREVVAAPPAALLDVVGGGLAELAAATPMKVPAIERGPTTARPSERLLPVVRDPQPEQDPGVATAASVARSAPVVRRLRSVASALRARLDDLPAARRRATVGGGAAVAVAALLLAVVPSGSDRPADAGPAERVPLAAAEGAAADATADAPPEPEDALSAAIAGDDPLAAAVALLERRSRCIAELSLLCLDEVDQAGSAALADDRRGVSALRDGGEAALPDVEPVQAILVERLGDAAIVRLGPETAPASLLVVRSEAGWRIRDWVAVG